MISSLFFSLLVLTNIVLTLQVPLHESDTSNSTRLISPNASNYINNLIAKWNSTGLSVAVVRKNASHPSGWNIDFGSYGIAHEDRSPMTPDTVFAIASNSKLFLAISVGLLISNETLARERGKEIKWTTKVKDLIPEWGLWDEDADRGVSLQDVLSHRTGMPRHDFSGVPRESGVGEMVSTLRHLRPSAEFRETFQYNNLMYETLSYLPRVLLNQSYESYVAQHLFAPLNMTSSTFSVKDAEARGTLATGFMWDMRDLTKGFNGNLVAQKPYFFRPGEERIWAGAGGVLTSARDLATWMAMLLNGGKHPYTNETVVPLEVVEHAALGRTVTHGKPEFPEISVKAYGCGQWRYSYQGLDIVEHGGNNPGYKSQVARFPDGNLAIATLSNDANGGYVLEAAKWRIVDELLGLKQLDWNDRYEKLWDDYVKTTQDLTPRPNPPIQPDSPISSLVGTTFKHPTCGSLRPCLVPSSFADNVAVPAILGEAQMFLSGILDTDYCSTILHSAPVQRILNASDLSIPTLIVDWKRTFATHLRLVHFSANLFNLTVIWTNDAVRQAEGYGSDGGDLVIGLDEHFEVEWVNSGEDRGLAFKGGFWGKEGPDSREPVGEGKGSAEVWFTLSRGS